MNSLIMHIIHNKVITMAYKSHLIEYIFTYNVTEYRHKLDILKTLPFCLECIVQQIQGHPEKNELF